MTHWALNSGGKPTLEPTWEELAGTHVGLQCEWATWENARPHLPCRRKVTFHCRSKIVEGSGTFSPAAQPDAETIAAEREPAAEDWRRSRRVCCE